MPPVFDFIGRINLRHWREHKLRTALTLFGVTTGVALVVAVMVINTTMLSTATDSAERLAGAADLEVASPDRTGLPGRAVERVAEVPGVDEAIPVLRTYSTVTGPVGSQRVLVLGITPSFPDLFGPEVARDGGFETSGSFGSGDGLMLAAGSAQKLGVSRGDSVTTDTPSGRISLEVTGTFSGSAVESLGASDLGAMFLPAAQDTFERAGRVDSVYVIAAPGTDSGALQEEIREVVKAGAVIGAPGDRARGYEDALNGMATLTSLAGTVALFVSAFVVFNTMSMSIAERRREIAMALALGATRKRVMAGFVGEAAVLGALASAIGIGAGYLLAKVFVGSALDALRVFTLDASSPASVHVEHVAIALASGLVVSVVGAYVPSKRIMNIAPVESLRPLAVYEDQRTGLRNLYRLIAGIAGVALIVAGIALGRTRTGSDLEQAAWLTNAALFLLLLGATFLLPLFVTGALRLIRRPLARSFGVDGRLAADALIRKPHRTTITVGALVLTLGVVIAVGAALGSYRTQWHNFSNFWYGSPVHVVPTSFETLGSDQPFPLRVQEDLERVDGVSDVSPVRYRVVNVAGRQTTIYVHAVPRATERFIDPAISSAGREYREKIARHLFQGEIVISRFAADKKDLEVGGRLTIPTPSGERAFTVGAVVYDLNPLDSLHMGEDQFLRYWDDTSVDRFEVDLEPGADRSTAMQGLNDVLQRDGIPAEVMTKEDLIQSSFELIEQSFSVAQGVQLAALLVALLAIANTMFIAVLERRWELGLQRAVGMEEASVTRSLLIEAGIIGVIGAAGSWILGLANGFLMTVEIERSFAFDIPFRMPWSLLMLTLVSGGVIAILAGIYPSKAATRTPIIEALRFE